MDDLISRKAAIDVIRKWKRYETTEGLVDRINNLPSAQPEKRTQECAETHACDCISRQAAIDVLDRNHILGQGLLNDTLDHIAAAIMALPSSQPETHEERTETHGVCLDVIDRQATLDWLKNEWNGMITSLFDGIKALPSAQPEPCVDTIDALDESIKHFDDMAEECRRNANIEQNDYMDMRDDAAEYRQLSIWLNELKWLRERFQSQPDLSEYSDKLWKAAYERGRAEAQAEIVRCKDCKHWKDSDGVYRRGINAESKCPVNIRAVYEGNFYCADAERRTDESDANP